LRDSFAKMMAISDERGYQYFAGIHGYPLPAYCDIAHGHATYFLPWHRAYLYFFERALLTQNPAGQLAWWDWTSPKSQRDGLPDAYRTKTGAGKRNPLFEAKVNDQALAQGKRTGDPRSTPTRRAPGQPGSNPLPTAEFVTSMLELSDFTDFSNQLEQAHGDVHMWVGGHMSDIAFASYDPIFWAHHTMIDRIWYLWQLKWGKRPPAAVLDHALPPFAMTVRQTLDIHALGYEYAASTAHAPAAPA
jgi:tyrosinase